MQCLREQGSEAILDFAFYLIRNDVCILHPDPDPDPTLKLGYGKKLWILSNPIEPSEAGVLKTLSLAGFSLAERTKV